MAVGETATQDLTVSVAETVPADASVRHFDQLTEAERTWLLAALDGATAGPSPAALDAGDVVVFTDYLRVRTA